MCQGERITTAQEQEKPKEVHFPWALEDEQLLQQCIQHDLWSDFFHRHQKKTRTLSDWGLLMVMVLFVSTAML
jgi:hypothetical protein